MSEEISLKKIGRVFMDSGEYRKAVRVLEMAVSDSPSDVTVRLDPATALYSAGREEDAKEQWQAVIELDENNSVAFYNLGCYYRDTAGEPDQAYTMFSKAGNVSDLCILNHGDTETQKATIWIVAFSSVPLCLCGF